MDHFIFSGVSDVVQGSGQMLFNGICDTCVVFNFKIILTINHKSGVILFNPLYGKLDANCIP